MTIGPFDRVGGDQCAFCMRGMQQHSVERKTGRPMEGREKSFDISQDEELEDLRTRAPGERVLQRSHADADDFRPACLAGRSELTHVELERALLRWIDATRPGDLTADLVRGHLGEGSVLLIVDSVDEVPLSHGEGPYATAPRARALCGLMAAAPKWIAFNNRERRGLPRSGLAPCTMELRLLHGFVIPRR